MPTHEYGYRAGVYINLGIYEAETEPEARAQAMADLLKLHGAVLTHKGDVYEIEARDGGTVELDYTDDEEY